MPARRSQRAAMRAATAIQILMPVSVTCMFLEGIGRILL
jgi:hypothetical protein